MRLFRTALLSCALAALLGGTAQAQGDQGDQQLSVSQLRDGWAVAITPGGKMTRRSNISPEMLRELMKDARPMSTASIMFMRDNKVYVVPDRSMQGGTMLSEQMAQPSKR